MYKRRRRYRTYSRIGRDVIDFYKDSKGRTRPITRRRGRARLPKIYVSQRVQLPKPLLDSVITRILLQAPVVKEIYTAYVLADSLCDNWNAITQLYEEYQKRGVQGVASRIGTDAVHNALSSIQTDAVWAMICGYIPKKYQNTGKGVLANVMETVTTAEIALAKQFLQQRDNSCPT
jgi:hypothetical protein